LKVTIQGIDCEYRDLLPDEEILYSDLPKGEQYFRRVDHPFTDDELVGIANKEYQYPAIKKQWVEKQNWLFDNGCYAYINGELTFIPGAYWCYINFWTLEHGDKPDYREDDREFFLFHEYLRLKTDVLGISRLKGRRQGATSIAMFFMWFIAGRSEHKLCGLTSFNDTAAQDAFQKMFMYGFKAMLPCFQADFDSDSENFIRFVKPVEKKRKGVLAVKREGLNSYCDYKSNAVNSYDSGRQSYNVPDEGGKRGSKVNINTYWSRLYKTLLVGSNKVGFAYLPTTVGLKKEGGENFKLFWKNANQYEIDKETKEPVGIKTINRVVRYFMPATRCYSGCIDKYGRSVIDDPAEPIISNEIDKDTGQPKLIKEGSRTLILRERNRLEGEQLMEHRRDYPLDEFDAFSFETGACEFNETKIREQLEYLEKNKEQFPIRRVRLVRREKKELNVTNNKERTIFWIEFEDDHKGDWYLWETPLQENRFRVIGDYIEPLNTLHYSIGVDTFKDEFAYAGSKGTICVFKKSLIEEGEEKGMYPVLLYIGRPRLLVHLYDEVMKACMWYGCKVNFELDAGTQYYNYFRERGAGDLLEWTPKIAIDPVKRDRKLKPGTQSADPFQLQQQLEVCKTYIDGSRNDNYTGHVHRIVYPVMLEQLIDYNHSERTPYDIVISLMMSILPAMGSTQESDMIDFKPKKLLPQYRISLRA